MITFDITGTGGFSVRVELQEQPDADNNRSELQCRLYLLSSKWFGVTYWLQGRVTGRDFSSNYDHAYIEQLNVPVAVGAGWSFTADHAADGTGAVTVSVNLRGYTESGSYGNGWKVEGSRTVALTPIALASTVQVTEGHPATVAVTRRNSSYSHLLHYEFGDLTGYIADDGTVSSDPVVSTRTVISFPVPEEFYGQLTHAASGLCLLTCTTLDGQRQVGGAQTCSFRISVPDTLGPVLTVSAEDVNPETVALTGDPAVAVRFKSRMQCTADARGQLGAEIVAVTAQGQPVPVVLEGPEQIVFQAADSRGLLIEQVLSPRVVPYILPTVNGTCSRVNPTTGCAEMTVQGSAFWGSFGKADNSLLLTASVDGRTYTLTPTRGQDRYTARVTLEGLSYERSYTVTVTARDALTEVTAELNVGRGVPVFDWGRKDFSFHVPITAPSVNGIRNPALKAWPVGAVLLMTADPKDYIGGKWEPFTIPGIDLDAWRRVLGADVLGTATLGRLVLGTEE